MGMDITTKLYDAEGRLVESFNFWNDGSRNYTWFNNITGNCIDSFKYENFPMEYVDKNDENLPAEIKEDAEQGYYFDFRRINVGKFKQWYETMKPWRRAGYFTEYEEWKISEGWKPNPDDVPICSDEDHYIFKTFEHEDPSTWLYEELDKANIPDNYYFYYYFDC